MYTKLGQYNSLIPKYVRAVNDKLNEFLNSEGTIEGIIYEPICKAVAQTLTNEHVGTIHVK